MFPNLIKVMTKSDYRKLFFKGRSSELIEFYSELLTNNPKEKALWEKFCFVLYMKDKFWELKYTATKAL